MGICWLASYPKSGNTWMRALLTACVRPEAEIDLQHLVGWNDLDTFERIEDATGHDPSLFTIDELVPIRARIFRQAHAESSEVRFLKTHLANLDTGDGTRLFDADCGRAVYLVRDPLDVAISYAHFTGIAPERIAALMVADETVAGRVQDRPAGDPPQPLTSWASHVRSWVQDPPLPVLIVRYEDLLADAEGVLAEVTRFAGLRVASSTISAAVERAAFGRLQATETASGFRENIATSRRFFRSGRSGEGREQLPVAWQQRLSAASASALDLLGYRPGPHVPSNGSHR